MRPMTSPAVVKAALHVPGLTPARAAPKLFAQAPAEMPILQTPTKAADMEQKTLPSQDDASFTAEVMQELPRAGKIRDAICHGYSQDRSGKGRHLGKVC